MERCRVRRQAPAFVFLGYVLWVVAALLMAIAMLVHLFASDTQASSGLSGVSVLNALVIALLIIGWFLTRRMRALRCTSCGWPVHPVWQRM